MEFTDLIKIKYNTIFLWSHSKLLTQTLDVVLTAVAAVHTDNEYGVSLGLPRSCREKKEHSYICLCVYI